MLNVYFFIHFDQGMLSFRVVASTTKAGNLKLQEGLNYFIIYQKL